MLSIQSSTTTIHCRRYHLARSRRIDQADRRVADRSEIGFELILAIGNGGEVMRVTPIDIGIEIPRSRFDRGRPTEQNPHFRFTDLRFEMSLPSASCGPPFEHRLHRTDEVVIEQHDQTPWCIFGRAIIHH